MTYDEQVNTSARVEPATKRTMWAWTIGTFFGAGFWKPGPGTAGSLAAAILWLVAAHLTWAPPSTASLLSNTQFAWTTAAAAFALLAIAIPAASIVARESGKKDPQRVVADEVVGQWVTLIAAPTNSKYALLGFLLFRAFDIIKPPPVRQMEYLPRGWGIMLDDVGAGIYAWVCLQLIHHFLH